MIPVNCHKIVNAFSVVDLNSLCHVISVYYGLVTGDKYERDNIDWQLSDDKAAESIHHQCPAGI